GGGGAPLGGPSPPKAAAAMAEIPAVRIHDDLAPGKPGVAERSADDEASGRIDQESRFLADHVLGQDRLYDFLDHALGERLVRDIFAMLGGNHYGIDVMRLVVDITHRYLGFRVGSQP